MRSVQVLSIFILLGLALAADKKNVIQVIDETQQKEAKEAAPAVKIPGATMIYNGNQISGNINNGDVQNYYSTIEDWMWSNNTYIYLVDTYIDIYVAVGYTPNTTNYDWGQSGYNTYKYLYLSGSAFTPGTLQITLYGRYTSSSFTLLFLSGSSSTLSSISQPTPGSVQASSYMFYQVTIPQSLASSDLAISIAGTGDPDIYASMSIQRPELNDYTWKSSNYGNDTLVISSSDPNYGVGTLYIGIYGYSVPSNFLINVYPNANTTALTNGITLSGQHALENTAIYYSFVAGNALSNQSIGIYSAVTVFGQIQFYASFRCIRPNSYCYDYYSYGGYTITINPTDSYYVLNAPLYIGVYAAQTSIFQIQLLVPSVTNTLYMGVPFADAASAGQYRFYAFSLASTFANNTINIQTTARSANLYASLTNARPMGSGTWSSTNGSLAIPAGAVSSGATLYIAQLSNYANSYTISATVGTVLPTTNATTYNLNIAPGYTWYSIDIPSPYCTATITVSSSTSTIYIYASELYTRPYGSYYSWYGYNQLQANAAQGLDQGTLYFSIYNYQTYATSGKLQTIVNDYSS